MYIVYYKKPWWNTFYRFKYKLNKKSTISKLYTLENTLNIKKGLHKVETFCAVMQDIQN